MNKAILFSMFTGGIALMYYGFGAYTSVEPDITLFFTGSSADVSLGMMGGGVVATLIGAGGLLSRMNVDRNS